MIIVRTPLRISFVGGGSDLPAFYNQTPGRVISAAIDKYVFVAINEKFDRQFRVGYSITEIVGTPQEIKNTRVRAALEHFGIDRGLEIISIGDVPSHGSGLGASSSFTVALVHGLSEYLCHPTRKSKRAIAEAACYVEMNKLGEQIGKQDQYAAAFGGVNIIDFKPEKVLVRPAEVSQKRLEEFREHLMVFYITGARNAAQNSHILSNHLVTDEERFLAQKTLAGQVAPFRNALAGGDFRQTGELLHEAWLLKQRTSPVISTNVVNEVYEIGRHGGAWGGKLLGAGGGGFILFIAPPRAQKKLRAALSNLQELPVGFDHEGSKIIFNRYRET